MDFKSIYPQFHKLKLSCNITDLLKVSKVVFGHGGSKNIILIAKNKNNIDIIVKIIPDSIYKNTKIKPNADQLEIKFYQFFTQKYILTDKTPHIVGIYNNQFCPDISKILINIKQKDKKCATYEEILSKKTNYTNNRICDLLLQKQMKIIDSTFNILLLEYCYGELSVFLKWNLNQINISKGRNAINAVTDFIYELTRILFQIIFTLAIIQNDYPGFLHGDFFVRNILLSLENTYKKNQYVSYHFMQRVFYLPANGIYAKINDFGMSIIANEIQNNTYELEKVSNGYIHKNPFNNKSDIFNLLHDIYDGQDLGNQSLLSLAYSLKISSEKMKPILDTINKFINIKTIDKLNKNNRMLLNQTWNIDKVSILEKTILTPKEYLIKNYFDIFQELPENSEIVKSFNSPNQKN